MADYLRAQVMIPGHCSFCGEPAERGLSGVWWHLGESCNVNPLAAVPAGAVPAGPLGFAAQWPPRFKPGPYQAPRPTDQPEGT